MASPAFLFPGQGSQHAGMGAGLLDDRELSALCADCTAAAGVNLRHLLLDAGDDELKLTENAQPALTFMGIALALLLRRRGIEPTAAAGHSVGEYAALCVAGALSAPDAVAAVAQRGRAMATAAPAGTTSMAAVLGLAPEAVRVALGDIPDVWPANFNTPTQTVIGGTVAALELATASLVEAGARKVVSLSVSAAFHTPLVASAAGRLRLVLDGIEWSQPGFPVVANLTAEPYSGAEEIPAVLEQQLRSPVLWGESVRRLALMGCDVFLELGPRRALTGMMKELVPGASAAALSTPEAVAAHGVA